ncbi:MAG TPA: CHAT domain-containing protein [Pyrinomonadaceae bacterium]|jgi:pimeloyl-ACP methyl ester carboxylesterase|nr:CHAT domain-containing protein [Pyrinomonadaceae bacterium]
MSFDERRFIARVEAANAEELARLLARPSADEERAWRVHLGDERFERMREMASPETVATRGQTQPKGNVVVIHGIMGAELSNFSSPTSQELIWVSYWRILRGWAERLKLNSDGETSKYDVRPTGVMKDYYGEMLLQLRLRGWNVQPFAFDWRKDINGAADNLSQKINEWFGEESAVHIVAHSMGGLVARSFIKKYPDRWASMWDASGDGRAGGRLVMLGTPTYGSFIIPQVITGIEPMVIKLAWLDARRLFGVSDILETTNTFPGSLQMLPSPRVMSKMEPLYHAQTYGKFVVSQQHLDNARRFHEQMHDVVDEKRMIYVAGFNRKTFSNIVDFKKIGAAEGYEVTLRGDGRVPHLLGIPRRSDNKPIERVYYIEEDHGELPRNRTILSIMDEMLSKGSTSALATSIPATMRGVGAEESAQTKLAARNQLVAEQKAEVERFRQLADSLKATRGAAAEVEAQVSPEERKIRASLLEGAPSAEQRDMVGPPMPFEIALLWSKINEVGEEAGSAGGGRKRGSKGPPRVDAISVGHYAGVGRPERAEQAIDLAISRALFEKQLKHDELKALLDARGEVPEIHRLLTLYSDRGIISGDLAQPFFLDDPRMAGERVIVLAGMGLPGRFGAPELTVLARELCWSLGRMGKKHLATVLIGAGKGNIPIEDALIAWMRGIRRAVTSSTHDEVWRLRRITFVENNPDRIENIQKAIINAQQRELQDSTHEQTLNIIYEPLDLKTLTNKDGHTLKQASAAQAREDARWRARQQQQTRGASGKQAESRTPSRITVTLEGNKYRFGAVTNDASVPEREIPLDPSLVIEANDELANTIEHRMQLDWGRHMENLLVPDDLRPAFKTDAPLLLTLDRTTARIHWEMIAQPDPLRMGDADGDAPTAKADGFDSFLSTSRGLTRQLRTNFAPPPEPPPPPRRTLRVLIVADPATDRSLQGAKEEGMLVADMFEAFNTVYPKSENRVKVTRLFGGVATRNNVLFHLTQRGPFDILHFAGHCTYDENDPSSSGWIFTGGKRLSANELSRIDNVPKFVFSNACESGKTPETRTDRLAPSFAESFFARGVANFVCTAWPVNDVASTEFALKLYAGLLGLVEADNPDYIPSADDEMPIKTYAAAPTPLRMHQAMRDARLAIARSPHGAKTWGAYQHYGNPYLQFFDPQALQGPPPLDEERRANSRAPQSVTKTAQKSSRTVTTTAKKPATKKARRGAKKSRKSDA